mmetsp:Transcript_95763/g.249626  ORF Transcript_95763/g.249626 Transcript_95763/m.249626 type:complete len:206 (+) Transcript_95763:262-879(+)
MGPPFFLVLVLGAPAWGDGRPLVGLGDAPLEVGRHAERRKIGVAGLLRGEGGGCAGASAWIDADAAARADAGAPVPRSERQPAAAAPNRGRRRCRRGALPEPFAGASCLGSKAAAEAAGGLRSTEAHDPWSLTASAPLGFSGPEGDAQRRIVGHGRRGRRRGSCDVRPSHPGAACARLRSALLPWRLGTTRLRKMRKRSLGWGAG